MSAQKIEAKLTGGQPVTVEYDYGDNLSDAVAKFGEDVVYSRYAAAITIDIQAKVRGLLKQTEPTLLPEEIQAEVSNWAPGVKARGKSPAEKAHELWARMSPEERERFLQELQLQS